MLTSPAGQQVGESNIMSDFPTNQQKTHHTIAGGVAQNIGMLQK
jgi:hypothetical protein